MIKYSETIKNVQGLENIIEGMEFKHSEYCHYSSVENINKILKGKSLKLSRVQGFNDKCDSAQFEDITDCFSFCFATGVHENLPMWQIYSGCHLDGARIQFKRGYAIEKLIKESKLELWRENEFNNRLNENDNSNYKPYILSDDEVYRVFHDVIYTQREGKWANIKYNNRFITQIPMDEFEKYMETDIDGWKYGHSGFKKSLIWFYEKETRLLVKLKDGVIDRAKKTELDSGYKSQDNKDGFVINLNFENIYNELLKKGRMQIVFAPGIGHKGENADIKDLDEIMNKNGESDAIRELRNATSCVQLSQYSGTVQFKLSCEKRK